MRPRISAGVVSCNTVVPIAINPMKPTPARNRMMSDTTNIGDRANKNSMTPKSEIVPISSALLWRVSPMDAIYMLPTREPRPLADMSQPAPLAFDLSTSLAKAGIT